VDEAEVLEEEPPQQVAQPEKAEAATVEESQP